MRRRCFCGSCSWPPGCSAWSPACAGADRLAWRQACATHRGGQLHRGALGALDHVYRLLAIPRADEQTGCGRRWRRLIQRQSRSGGAIPVRSSTRLAIDQVSARPGSSLPPPGRPLKELPALSCRRACGVRWTPVRHLRALHGPEQEVETHPPGTNGAVVDAWRRPWKNTAPTAGWRRRVWVAAPDGRPLQVRLYLKLRTKAKPSVAAEVVPENWTGG